jgi:RNA polymerase sigma factor (sigma-70 family)
MQCMSGDAEADFDEVFDDVRALAYRAAYRLLGLHADAEDVAAETLARVYARWPSVASHVEPWAIAVATNLALDRGRRRSSADRYRNSQSTSETQPDPNLEQRLDLQAALRSLPRRQREVVALRFLADWSAADTASALGLDIGTVKSHTARGLAKLRTIVMTET